MLGRVALRSADSTSRFLPWLGLGLNILLGLIHVCIIVSSGPGRGGGEGGGRGRGGGEGEEGGEGVEEGEGGERGEG